MIRRSLFVVMLFVLAIPLFAQVQEKQPDGMQVAVDENGQLRQPTAAEMQALAPKARPSILRVQASAHGLSITLDESFDHVYSVRTDDEGNFLFNCTDDHHESAAFVAKTASIDTILRVKPQTQRARVAERE
jgi:hypothetical protein